MKNKVKYFAYGSNMNTDRIKGRISSAECIGIGKLNDYKLVCNKKSTDGSAKANVEEKEDAEVWGVIFEINKNDLVFLDRIERGYKRIEVKIKMGDSVINVYTYSSGNITKDKRVFSDYKGHIVSGAEENNLPKEYIERLKKKIEVK